MPASIKHLKQLFSKDIMSVVLFCKWPADNLYYVITLQKLDEKKDRCYVRYEDGTECWVDRHDVHLQFNTSTDPYQGTDDIYCCLCDVGTSVEPNEIILCDVCQQGYHQDCHQPKIRQADIENSSQEWCCQTCSYIMSQLDPMAKTSTPKVKTRPKKQQSPRRAILKASQAKKQNRIKLSRDKVDKKSSQESANKLGRESAKNENNRESAKSKPVAPVASPEDSSVESVPGDSTDDSPEELPLRELPEDASLDGDKKIIETAKALVDSIGTNDFVEAIAQKAEPKAKVKNEKIPRKVPVKKSVKVPVPA